MSFSGQSSLGNSLVEGRYARATVGKTQVVPQHHQRRGAGVRRTLFTLRREDAARWIRSGIDWPCG